MAAALAHLRSRHTLGHVAVEQLAGDPEARIECRIDTSRLTEAGANPASSMAVTKPETSLARIAAAGRSPSASSRRAIVERYCARGRVLPALPRSLLVAPAPDELVEAEGGRSPVVVPLHANQPLAQLGSAFFSVMPSRSAPTVSMTCFPLASRYLILQTVPRAPS